MRISRAIVAGLLASIAWLPASGAGAVEIEEVTTPLGIKAWLVEDKTTPIVALSFSFATGTASEDEKQRGVTQLTAALLTDGAGPFSSLAFKQRLEEASVSISFGASFDRFSGSMRALSANREESFDLLRLAMTAPRFEKEALDQRRAQTLSGINQAQQRPPSVAARAMMGAMFAGHPYANDPEGTRETLAALTPEDLKRRAAAVLTRSGLIVAAVGDIDEAELTRQIDRAFGALPAGALKAPPPDWTPPTRPRTVVIERAVPQSVVLMALPGVPRNDPDWYAAFVMNHILGGGGMQSRIFTEVREKRGLAYGASTSLRNYRKASLMVASTASASEKVAEAIKVIRGEFVRMREGVSEAELTDAKTFLTGALALSLDSSSSIASLMHAMQIDGLAPDHLTKRGQLIAAVKGEDIKRVARRMLRDDAITTIVVGKPVGVASDPRDKKE